MGTGPLQPPGLVSFQICWLRLLSLILPSVQIHRSEAGLPCKANLRSHLLQEYLPESCHGAASLLRIPGTNSLYQKPSVSHVLYYV